MLDMITVSATDARKEWSSYVDQVVRERPLCVKRTRDRIWLTNLETMKELLKAYHFTAERYIEPDASVTLSLNEIDLIENAPTEQEARLRMGHTILEYALEYYNNYAFYSHAPNRRSHVPYVFKALISDDADALGEEILCLDGKN